MRTVPLAMIMSVAWLSAVRAVEEVPPAAAAASNVQVQVQVTGDDADGETKPSPKKSTIVLRLGSDGKVELKDALPPDVRKKVQEAVEKAAEQPAPQADRQARVIDIRSFDIGGSITVIGPDGVARTQKIGGAAGNPADIQGLLDKALEAAGAGLPDDVAEQLRQAFDAREKDAAADAPAGMAAVVDRLDRILERLEAIERKLGRLEAAEKPDEE